MISGTIEKNGKICCGKCKREVTNYGVADLNYCSFCGNPLNELAVKLKAEENRSAKLETVKEIMTMVKSPNELILIAEYSKKI